MKYRLLYEKIVINETIIAINIIAFLSTHNIFMSVDIVDNMFQYFIIANFTWYQVILWSEWKEPLVPLLISRVPHGHIEEILIHAPDNECTFNQYTPSMYIHCWFKNCMVSCQAIIWLNVQCRYNVKFCSNNTNGSNGF